VGESAGRVLTARLRAVDDQRLGATVRLLRRRRGWRQADLGGAARISRAAVSRLERGHLDGLTIDTFRRIAAAIDLRIDFVPRWRGAEVDRMLGRRHSLLHEAFAQHLRALPAWTFRPEVSYSIYGERGVIDMLAWHAASAMLLVVEFKTELVDVNELIGTMDRRRRLAIQVGRDFGWHGVAVSCLVVLVGSRTNRRRATEHRTILRAAFPADGRRLATWLRDPRQASSVLAMWPNARHETSGPDSKASGGATEGLSMPAGARPRTNGGSARAPGPLDPASEPT
jgi:transcriptional regulator with XRE-family HTH domain